MRASRLLTPASSAKMPSSPGSLKSSSVLVKAAQPMRSLLAPGGEVGEADRWQRAAQPPERLGKLRRVLADQIDAVAELFQGRYRRPP
jgi:hypothetical protein